ncbi:hypothetical protein DYB32_002253 [Aphanomyces invadans]|uniref:Protein kinase domain-containing protein n=1 Tax=Aphanomyces invadans TaxID=157072 RepID=A0A3R7ACX6_9STRA|nr:hypothetical protein DYB32_002253 [Aphanomyces invadans]
MAVELDQIVRLDDDACSPLDALGRNVSLASIKNISDLYPLPSQLKMLYVNSLDDGIPPTSIQGNRYKSLANLNWTNMTLVYDHARARATIHAACRYLNGCYMLQSMDMVRFSSAIENVYVSLVHVDATECSFSQYTPFKTPSVRRPSDNTCDSIDLRALASIRLNERDVHLHDIMGTGAFANVWAGSFRGDAVAVKALLSTCVTPHHVESFVAEIQLMASFHSPYIVRVVGACWTTPSDLKCVMEFMDGGDLKHYLDTHTAAAFPWVQKYRHMHSIAEGLAYLHARNVIHRDIKSRNVVVDSTHGTKLTDFGTSKEDILATMTMGVGTFRWMAPEVLQDAGYTISADIYSFGKAACSIRLPLTAAVAGMVLSELDTHHAPYVDHVNPANGHPVADGAIILKVINGSIKPTFTPECPRWVFDLAMRCLDLDPTNRPTAMQISFEIGKFLHDL